MHFFHQSCRQGSQIRVCLKASYATISFTSPPITYQTSLLYQHLKMIQISRFHQQFGLLLLCKHGRGIVTTYVKPHLDADTTALLPLAPFRLSCDLLLQPLGMSLEKFQWISRLTQFFHCAFEYHFVHFPMLRKIPYPKKHKKKY